MNKSGKSKNETKRTRQIAWEWGRETYARKKDRQKQGYEESYWLEVRNVGTGK